MSEGHEQTSDIAAKHPNLFGSGTAYVANRDGGSVSVVDLNRLQEITTITVEGAPHTPAASPDGRFVYVSDNQNGTLLVISTQSNTLVATVDLNEGPFTSTAPWGVVVSPDSRFVYVANSGSSNVSVVDARRLVVTAEVPLSSGGFAIGITPDGRQAYVRMSSAAKLAIVDLSTNLRVKEIDMCSGLSGLGIARNKPLALMACPIVAGVLRVINTRLAAIALDAITTGGAPDSIAFNPEGTVAYVTNAGGEEVFVIDVFRHTKVLEIPVGQEPRGVKVTDNGLLAVVANSADDTVSVIDTRRNIVVGTVDVGAGPWYLDVV